MKVHSRKVSFRFRITSNVEVCLRFVLSSMKAKIIKFQTKSARGDPDFRWRVWGSLLRHRVRSGDHSKNYTGSKHERDSIASSVLAK